MSIIEFNTLSDSAKENFIWENATFVKNLTVGIWLCDVYKIDYFFVSVSFKIDVNDKAEISAHIYPEFLPLVRSLYGNLDTLT